MRRIFASEWVAAKIGRSETGEGPNPMPRRTRPTKPLPEPADATFTVLLQEAAQSGSRRQRAWAQLIDHLIAGERDAEQEELRGGRRCPSHRDDAKADNEHFDGKTTE